MPRRSSPKRTAFAAAELEGEFAEMNGYEAESEAAVLLNGLGIPEELRNRKMKELEGGDKVRVLLAQALFGNPDVLLLDEPTNHLDLKSIAWLEDFLFRFQNTVIVVSHDRHFLNQVCTHVADIDFGRIQVYVGNYDFWYQASQLTLKQKQDDNRKVTDKANELKEFIQRFSSNASKARQATSRKRLLEKLTIEEMPVSSRKYPYVVFKPERPCGDIILEIRGSRKEIDGVDGAGQPHPDRAQGGQDCLCRRQQPGQDHPVPDPGRRTGAGQRQLPLGGNHHPQPIFPRRTRLFRQRPESGRMARPVLPPGRRGVVRPRISREDALLRRGGDEEDQLSCPAGNGSAACSPG